jgi:hypothetical protein
MKGLRFERSPFYAGLMPLHRRHCFPFFSQKAREEWAPFCVGCATEIKRKGWGPAPCAELRYLESYRATLRRGFGRDSCPCGIEYEEWCVDATCRRLVPQGFLAVVDFALGDVVQLIRTLLSHRHNDVSDSKLRRLAQTTSVRPVTVSAISLHFRKLVVRSLKIPDVFLLRDRNASSIANSFRQELIAELFDEES